MKGQASELAEFDFDWPREGDFAKGRQVNPTVRAHPSPARFAGVFG
jgi:hypothetical protein